MLPLPLLQHFPFLLLFFLGVILLFGQPLPLCLVLQPFLPANMTDLLRSGLLECPPPGVVARLERSEPFAQHGQAEISVHAGRLDRRVSHKNNSAGTVTDETQTDRIQSGMKLLPAGGVLNDGAALFLRYPLCGFSPVAFSKSSALGQG